LEHREQDKLLRVNGETTDVPQACSTIIITADQIRRRSAGWGAAFRWDTVWMFGMALTKTWTKAEIQFGRRVYFG